MNLTGLLANTNVVLGGMGRFKSLVDRTMALVKDKGRVSIAALAYLLDVSPDYARKVAKSAVAISPELMGTTSVTRSSRHAS